MVGNCLLRGILVVFVVSLILVSSCKKSEETTGPTPSGDLFPLKVGNYAVYNEWTLDANNNKVTGSDHRYSTTVGFQMEVRGVYAYALIDSTFNPDGSLKGVDTLYVQKESNGDLKVFLELAKLASKSGLPITIPIEGLWTYYIKPSAGIGSTYTVLDTTVTLAPLPLTFRITVTGQVQLQETVAVPEGTYDGAYKTVTTINVLSSGTPFATIDRYLWLAAGVGPIKELQPSKATVLGTSQGYQHEMTYKRLQ